MDDHSNIYVVELTNPEQKRLSQYNHMNGSTNLLTTAANAKAAEPSEFNIDLIQSGEDLDRVKPLQQFDQNLLYHEVSVFQLQEQDHLT